MTRTIVQTLSAGMILSALIVGPFAISTVASHGVPSAASGKILCFAKGISCGNGPVLMPAVLGMR
ncbi:hypothetical protein [Amorphus orientalis]|uniref:Uncharacterized protein n=1 Tax=Amorphus orientalis TaxID=649198 RepID=A0AAE3VPI2_9HYPH|nr:hypothetical protein [Amorphus orientalis]MDQ0316449.1 hypothetical protein [Amorphus orientalis]